MEATIAVMENYTHGKKLDPNKIYYVRFSNIMEGLDHF
jgi:hypothetical protein